MRSLLLASILIAGCVADEADVDLDETSSDLLTGPTVLSFYESSNATGRTLSVSLASVDDNELIKLVSKPDIETAGLLGKVSAVRLSCRQRPARVVLFDAYNASNTSFSSWSHTGGRTALIECSPYQTVTVNLHTNFPDLADRVGSAFLVNHAVRHGLVDYFLATFQSAWDVELDDMPDGVTPGRTYMWMSTSHRFHIRQFLTIDSWACTARGAVFEYSILMRDDETFSVSVTDSYVNYGFGDAWSCRDTMKAKLDDSIRRSSTDLAAGLHDLLHAFAPDHARYYFVPRASLASFDLFYGADPLENAPL
jgi:hypothetical protein